MSSVSLSRAVGSASGKPIDRVGLLVALALAICVAGGCGFRTSREQSAIDALVRIRVSTKIGVTKDEYRRSLIEAGTLVDSMPLEGDGKILHVAMSAYQDALDIWNRGYGDLGKFSLDPGDRF